MKFKPMLAATLSADFDVMRYPALASAKLDGIRAMVQSGRLVSRSLKLIPNRYVQRLFGRAELECLDGELIVGDPRAGDCFTRTSSAIMSADGEPHATFRVFDCYDPRLVFARRLEQAERAMRRVRRALPSWNDDAMRPSTVASCLQLVEHWSLADNSSLLRLETSLLERGYEGVMLRDPYGIYKQGRSTLREGGLLKLKRFCDGEAMVIGVEELMYNDNVQERDALGHSKRSSKKAGLRPAGMLGALLVRDLKTKVEFSIGSGFTEELRCYLWACYGKAPNAVVGIVGELVKYRYFPTGGKERPRFPVFIGFRDRSDT